MSRNSCGPIHSFCQRFAIGIFEMEWAEVIKHAILQGEPLFRIDRKLRSGPEFSGCPKTWRKCVASVITVKLDVVERDFHERS